MLWADSQFFFFLDVDYFLSFIEFVTVLLFLAARHVGS